MGPAYARLGWPAANSTEENREEQNTPKKSRLAYGKLNAARRPQHPDQAIPESWCNDSGIRIAPAFGATLQGPDPDRGGLEVDVLGANCQGFGNPGTGVGKRERRSLAGWPRRPGGGGEETPAFIGGEVLAVGVDELEIADQAIHFAWRNVRSGPCARSRLGFPELENPRDRALQGLRGGPQMRHYVNAVGIAAGCVEAFADGWPVLLARGWHVDGLVLRHEGFRGLGEGAVSGEHKEIEGACAAGSCSVIEEAGSVGAPARSAVPRSATTTPSPRRSSKS